MSGAKRRRLGCGVRLLLLVIALAAGMVPVWFLLPDSVLAGGLGRSYPAERYDLSDPALLLTWRLAAAAVAGVVVCLVFAVAALAVRRASRKRAWRETPAELRELRTALRRGPEERLVEAVRAIGRQRGAEAVDDLLTVLDSDPSEEVRREVAAALYHVGRAVTAEISFLPGATRR